MRRSRVVVPGAVMAAGLLTGPVAQAEPTVIYVNNTYSGCSDTGAGTRGAPYCTPQLAADVVEPGQVVSLRGTKLPAFTVTRSGTAQAPIVFEGADGVTARGITVRGAQHVQVRTVKVPDEDRGAPLNHFVVDGGSDVVVDRVWSVPGIAVVGGAHHVSVTRSRVERPRGRPDMALPGVLVQGGADNVVAGNYVNGGIVVRGITVSGSPGTAVTGNTVYEACGAGIAVTGDAARATVANNIAWGTYSRPSCNQGSPAAELSVDATAAAGVSAHHNTLHSPGLHVPYSWAGTTYVTAAALFAATGQGAQDLDTPQAAIAPNALPTFPAEGSPSIDSADSSAPGALTTDHNGSERVDDPFVTDTGAGPRTHFDRGAFERPDRWTGTGVVQSSYRAPVGGPISLRNGNTTGWSSPLLSCTTAWGDGTTGEGCAPSHAYTTTGTFQIRHTSRSASGLTREDPVWVNIVPAGPFAPTVVGQPDNGLFVNTNVDAGPWDVASVTVDFGDGRTPVTVAGSTGVGWTYAEPGTYPITATITDVQGNTGTARTTVATAGTAFTPLRPTRLLDTRNTAKLAPWATTRLKVGGTAGIPTGITTAVVNLTVTNPTAAGFLTAHADDVPLPESSTLNFTAGKTIPNLAFVAVAANGYLDIANGSPGTVDVIADVSGYFAPTRASRFTTPDGTDNRLLDTRLGGAPPIPAGGTVQLTPPPGTTAAVLNITTADPGNAGHLIAYPSGTPRPVTSNVNFETGQYVANAAVVPVGADGRITVYTTVPTHIVVDLTGVFRDNGTGHVYNRFTTTGSAPVRSVDTRTGLGQDWIVWPIPANSPQYYRAIRVTPPGGATVINTTVTNPQKPGHITVYPGTEPRPVASTLNFAPGRTVANFALASPTTSLAVHNNSAGTIDLVIDQVGYFG